MHNCFTELSFWGKKYEKDYKLLKEKNINMCHTEFISQKAYFYFLTLQHIIFFLIRCLISLILLVFLYM